MLQNSPKTVKCVITFETDCSLAEIRLGRCGAETSNLMNRLKRPLPMGTQEHAVHVFFRRQPVGIHNMNVLTSLPGEMFSFEAIDEGDTGNIKCPAPKCLKLKVSSKIMMLWNKSSKLRNGTAGILADVQGEVIIAEFPQGKVRIERETWYKLSPDGGRIGSRTQFPVVLMYAIACHKAQGLTLPAAVVHCSKEFVSGLLYVALSRVPSFHVLQVLNFAPCQLLPPPTECLEVCEQQVVAMSSIQRDNAPKMAAVKWVCKTS